MNVLFLSTWFPYPPDNGSKLRVYHLLRALANKHDVTLLAFDFDAPGAASATALAADLADVEKIVVNPFVAAGKASFFSRLSWQPTTTRTIPAMRDAVRMRLEQDAVDAIIASTFVCSPYPLESFPPTVRVLEEHNSLTRWIWDRYQQERSSLSRLRRWLSWQKTRRFEAHLFNQFDLVTAVSAQDAHAMTAMLPGFQGPVEVVPNGVDCQHNRPGMHRHIDNMLVYNGALTYGANLDAMQYFLSAILPRVRQNVPDVRLTITGSTTGVDLSHIALNDAVHFSGCVPDVRVLVAQAAVCVVPLRDGGGTRLKILEAMALGTPVVATSKGAEGLEVVDGTHLLVADTPEAFASAVTRLLRESGLRAALAANARRLVEEKYDWQQIGARFVELVEQAIALKRNRLRW